MSAKDYIDLFEREWSRNQNFMNLYQDTSEFVYPLENEIVNKQTPGNEPKTIDLVDVTAIIAAQDMASNMSSALFPPGQKSFAYETKAKEESEEAELYLSHLTEAAHDIIFGPNFLIVFNETLRSWTVFGDGDIYSERGKGATINFRDYHAGSFLYLENSEGKVDTFIEKFEWTAAQCVEKWGDNAGKKMKDAAAKEETAQKKFPIVHVIRPRKGRDVTKIGIDNAPFEDVYVSVEDRHIMQNGGFREFPHAIGRYSKSSRENRGRGLGVFALPAARSLNAIKRDLVECGNRHNRPSLEVVDDNVPGEICLDPGAINHVAEKGSINAIAGSLGSYPVTKDIYESERQDLKDIFLDNVWNQLSGLTGDRRTTLEISERLNEGLKKLASPIARLISEILNPLLTRIALLMIRNGMVPPPPPSLEGREFKIEYLSPLILALKRHQAQAFMEWVAFASEMEAVFPGVKDNINSDVAIRDMADAFGVKPEHKRSIDERDNIRAQRAAELQQQKAMEAAQMASNAYSQTSNAPEDGSAAKEMQEALTG